MTMLLLFLIEENVYLTVKSHLLVFDCGQFKMHLLRVNITLFSSLFSIILPTMKRKKASLSIELQSMLLCNPNQSNILTIICSVIFCPIAI